MTTKMLRMFAETLGVGFVILVLAACESAPVVLPNPEDQALGVTETTIDPGDILPEPVPASVLDYLEREDFRENWDLWPGKGRQYEGSAPHGALLTVYLNDLALEAVQSRRGTMPLGAMVIKDNFSADGILNATTLMYKRMVPDSDSGPWFWMKWQPEETIEAAGAVDSCLGCHGMASANDYLMTGSIQ